MGVPGGERGDLQRWLQLVHIGDEKEAPDGDLVALAAKHLWQRPLSHWQRTLSEPGTSGKVWLVPSSSVKRLAADISRFDAGPIPAVRKRVFPGCAAPLAFVTSPMRLSLTAVVDIAPPPLRGEHTREIMARIGEPLPAGAGVIPYPTNKPLIIWLGQVLRWGYFAWRSGNI